MLIVFVKHFIISKFLQEIQSEGLININRVLDI